MAALYTAIVRNFSCVVRSLLPPDHAINAIAFPSAPPPLNEVTAVDALVAATQALAIYFFFTMGIREIWQGAKQWRRVKRQLVELDAISMQKHDFGSAEFTILRHSMLSEKSNSVTGVLVGVAVLVLFAGYFPLLANSLHIRGETHPKPVIDALLMMETFVACLLCIMWKAFRGKASSSARCRRLADLLQSQESTPSPLSRQQVIELAVQHGLATDTSEVWSWLENSADFGYKTHGDVLGDLRAIHAFLHPPSPSAKDPSASQYSLAQPQFLHLRSLSADLKVQSWLAAVTFLLNLVAWYGYLQCITVFYLPRLSNGGDWISRLGQRVMLGMDPKDAEFYGTFAGDLAWTLDPLFALLQPALIGYLTKMRTGSKPAGDTAASSQKKDQ